MRTVRRRLRRSVRAEVFREYCANSSIHGVRYFDRDERTSCERFWWLVVFLLSMAGCGVMIYKTYVKWNQVPIIVTFSEKTTPVWDMHFPAITICPETKISVAKFNFTAEVNDLLGMFRFANRTIREDLVGQIKAVSQLCNFMFHEMNDWLNYINGTEDNVVGVMKNLSLARKEVIVVCIYGNAYTYCLDYISETITEEGLCYTFNMRPESEIFRKGALHTEYNYTEDWYTRHYSRHVAHDEELPLYARGAGLHAGLMLYLKHSRDNTDYMCTVRTSPSFRSFGNLLSHLLSQGFSQGYKVMIHDPDEYPQVSMRNMRLPLGNEISIALKPQMIVTSQSAADYSWEKRQCFFNHERRLRFFQIYNQQNCELECLTNVTLELCKCVRFSMPRANETKVCALSMWHCMNSAKWFLRPVNREALQHHEHLTEMVKRCNCLPACSSVHYDAEVTQTTLDMESFLRAHKDLQPDAFNDFMLTTVAIYFKESYFITSKRSELYGWVDFLANCGGLLGLFMGVSFLSLLEIFYFLTIRPFSARKKIHATDQRKPNEVHNSLLAVVTKVD
ncbi:pickpocket protein 28-like [Anopheles marshallii]|uniref:pickpocket protein 28-like n=1 Tax=Anopheles marshallii TaxID=1521116 RepID=UPI00237C2086|nr:pickpocket protein 28-like [Anopheles marshallii]